jgi:hypothetical protein
MIDKIKSLFGGAAKPAESKEKDAAESFSLPDFAEVSTGGIIALWALCFALTGVSAYTSYTAGIYISQNVVLAGVLGVLVLFIGLIFRSGRALISKGFGAGWIGYAATGVLFLLSLFGSYLTFYIETANVDKSQVKQSERYQMIKEQIADKKQDKADKQGQIDKFVTTIDNANGEGNNRKTKAQIALLDAEKDALGGEIDSLTALLAAMDSGGGTNADAFSEAGAGYVSGNAVKLWFLLIITLLIDLLSTYLAANLPLIDGKRARSAVKILKGGIALEIGNDTHFISFQKLISMGKGGPVESLPGVESQPINGGGRPAESATMNGDNGTIAQMQEILRRLGQPIPTPPMATAQADSTAAITAQLDALKAEIASLKQADRLKPSIGFNAKIESPLAISDAPVVPITAGLGGSNRLTPILTPPTGLGSPNPTPILTPKGRFSHDAANAIGKADLQRYAAEIFRSVGRDGGLDGRGKIGERIGIADDVTLRGCHEALVEMGIIETRGRRSFLVANDFGDAVNEIESRFTERTA